MLKCAANSLMGLKVCKLLGTRHKKIKITISTGFFKNHAKSKKHKRWETFWRRSRQPELVLHVLRLVLHVLRLVLHVLCSSYSQLSFRATLNLRYRPPTQPVVKVMKVMGFWSFIFPETYIYIYIYYRSCIYL